jgi:hypothetical protein
VVVTERRAGVGTGGGRIRKTAAEVIWINQRRSLADPGIRGVSKAPVNTNAYV